MLKLLGSFMIIAAGTLAGLNVSCGYKQKMLLHKKLVRLYSETAIMLEYSFPTFAEIIEHLRSCGEYSEFGFLYKSTDGIDIKSSVLGAVDSWDTGLESSSKSELRAFFSRLGTTDIQGQIAYARLAAASEQGFIDSVSEKYRQRAKMSRTFGVLGGVFAAIMIV